MFKKRSSWIIFLLTIVSVFSLVSFLSLISYGESLLRKPDRYSNLNTYWQESLNLETLGFPLGAHYWGGDGLFFPSSDGYLLKAKWSQGRLTVWGKMKKLPDDFEAPARFVHEKGALASRDSIYHWEENSWKLLTDGFIAWHKSVEYIDDDVLMIGEYGERVVFFNLDDFSISHVNYKPLDTRHFHFVRKDPYTGHFYASLGDTHTNFITGIMVSKDSGVSWEWLKKTERKFEIKHKQPTAIYFLPDKIIFGSDSSPDGIYLYDRSSGDFHQPFFMDYLLKSWFTDIQHYSGVFWAISRSFGQRPAFGILWASVDGLDWRPIQVFEKAPMWLGYSEQGLITVGFDGEERGVLLQTPSADLMKAKLEKAPGLEIDFIDKNWVVFSRLWVNFFKDVVRMVYRNP